MPPTPVLATSRAQGFHPDPLEEPPSRIVRTGRRRSEPPYIEQAAPGRSDLSGGQTTHGADPTTRPSIPPPPIRGQMVRRCRSGHHRRTQPRPLPDAGPAAATATTTALGRGRRRAAAGQGRPATPRRPDRPCHLTPRSSAPSPWRGREERPPPPPSAPGQKAGGVLRRRRREGWKDGEPPAARVAIPPESPERGRRGGSGLISVPSDHIVS